MYFRAANEFAVTGANEFANTYMSATQYILNNNRVWEEIKERVCYTYHLYLGGSDKNKKKSQKRTLY